jgi:hydrogenase nickel incorporation protein HypA/HybF
MHDMSLVQELLRQVEQLRREHDADRVTAITVLVGELAGVEPELLRSAYKLLAPSAGLGSAQLDLTPVPLEGRCQTCGRAFRVEHFHFLCPACGGSEVTVLQGDSLVLQRLVFETHDSRVRSQDSGVKEVAADS